MRDITVKITHREMYEMVRDDAKIMEIDRAIEDLAGERKFCMDLFDADPSTLDKTIADLNERRNTRIENIFRSRLNRLDRDQLVDLIMTGEYHIGVPTTSEAGIDRTERHDMELFKSRTESLIERECPAARTKQPARRRARRPVPPPDMQPASTEQVPPPADKRGKARFRRKTRNVADVEANVPETT